GVGEVDVICGGFPCQAFSIAGNRGGFDDARGTLFFEIARFASILKPKLLFLENVTGLLNHEGGATFETIIRALDEIGYDCEWDCINSKHYVPQNRDRVFLVGHLRGKRTRKVFPFAREGGATSEKQSKINVVGSTKGDHQTSLGQREIVYGTNGIMGTLTATDYKGPKQIAIPVLTPDRIEKRQNGRRFKDNNDEMFTLTAQDRRGVVVGNIQSKGFKNNGNIYSTEGIAPTVTTRNNGDQGIKIKEATKIGHSEALPGDSVNISHSKSKTRRGRVGKQIANTLLTGEEQAVITDNFRIRKLTPRECWRLQGFPNWAFEKAATVNSNSQLYKQAGNSVTVPVIYEIAKRLEVYA
ncbi:DNA cytosine methyltransferase, partial [Carnobacterium divergens]|nr:DNA cytosine methyltransferase [Carnobacterium divergens]MDT1975482.1 DNA cytosine methyltransferase [Carnobacterium divergens]